MKDRLPAGDEPTPRLISELADRVALGDAFAAWLVGAGSVGAGSVGSAQRSVGARILDALEVTLGPACARISDGAPGVERLIAQLEDGGWTTRRVLLLDDVGDLGHDAVGLVYSVVERAPAISIVGTVEAREGEEQPTLDALDRLLAAYRYTVTRDWLPTPRPTPPPSMRGLDPTARRLLDILALVPRAVPVDALSEVVGAPAERVLQSLADAGHVVCRLGRVRLASESVRADLAERLAADTKRRTYIALSEALARPAAPGGTLRDAELAGTFLCALGRPERAAPLLEAAADAAFAAGASLQAARLYRDVLATPSLRAVRRSAHPTGARLCVGSHRPAERRRRRAPPRQPWSRRDTCCGSTPPCRT